MADSDKGLGATLRLIERKHTPCLLEVVSVMNNPTSRFLPLSWWRGEDKKKEEEIKCNSKPCPSGLIFFIALISE